MDQNKKTPLAPQWGALFDAFVVNDCSDCTILQPEDSPATTAVAIIVPLGADGATVNKTRHLKQFESSTFTINPSDSSSSCGCPKVTAGSLVLVMILDGSWVQPAPSSSSSPSLPLLGEKQALYFPDSARIEECIACGNNNSSSSALWDRASELFGPAFEGVPLLRSKQAATYSSSSSASNKKTRYDINLWWAKAGTNCAIHNGHNFKEVHTQVLGVGRMQVFSTNYHETDLKPVHLLCEKDYHLRSLQEEVLMVPGFTHQPFFVEDSTSPFGFSYPWHQYRADSDCIWVAIEYDRQGE